MPLRVLRRHLKRPLRLLKPAALFIRGWCPTDALHQDWYQIRSNLLSLLEPAQRLLEMSSVKPSRHPAVMCWCSPTGKSGLKGKQNRENDEDDVPRCWLHRVALQLVLLERDDVLFPKLGC